MQRPTASTAFVCGGPHFRKHTGNSLDSQTQAAMTSKYGSIPVCRIHLSELLKTLIMLLIQQKLRIFPTRVNTCSRTSGGLESIVTLILSSVSFLSSSTRFPLICLGFCTFVSPFMSVQFTLREGPWGVDNGSLDHLNPSIPSLYIVHLWLALPC